MLHLLEGKNTYWIFPGTAARPLFASVAVVVSVAFSCPAGNSITASWRFLSSGLTRKAFDWAPPEGDRTRRFQSSTSTVEGAIPFLDASSKPPARFSRKPGRLTENFRLQAMPARRNAERMAGIGKLHPT
jgi:hypothetical protein